MLSTMAPTSPNLPIFNFDFTTTTSHKPAHSSPLSSSPIRASQSSPPLSPRDPNALSRRAFHSSPINFGCENSNTSKWTKFDKRETKKNPLKQNRESATEGRRKLFLKNVRQRQDDNFWERRGGDQEALKLEWATIERRRRQQKDTDIDGLMFEDDLDDIIEPTQVQQQTTIPDDDEIMADTHAMEEEAELEAMLSTYETQSPALEPQRPESPSLSDDEYDGLFMDLILQSGNQHQRSAEDLVLSGQMDMS